MTNSDGMSATPADPITDMVARVLSGETALRIIDERDELRDILRDIVRGADMMLQPSMQLTGSFLAYVREVRRVAKSGVSV